MESKVLDSVLRGAGVRREPVDEIQTGDRKRGTEEGYGTKEVELKKNYDAVSRNGDTLELSEEGKRRREHTDMDQPSVSGEKVISGSGKKISDNILTGYSETKLKQLYANREITKQQYDRIMKRKLVDRHNSACRGRFGDCSVENASEFLKSN